MDNCLGGLQNETFLSYELHIPVLCHKISCLLVGQEDYARLQNSRQTIIKVSNECNSLIKEQACEFELVKNDKGWAALLTKDKWNNESCF